MRFVVGAGIRVLNGRSFLRSGVRRLAAAAIYGVGHLLDTPVS